MMSNRTLQAAQSYLARGFRPIPIPLGKKGAVRPGWQNLRLSAEELPDHFGGPSNLSVLLGEPSGGLTDVDLDSREVRALAPQFLPPTDSIFGRPGNPASHWLYAAPGGRTRKFRDPLKTEDDERSVLVEIRSTGCQTVFPPSIHPSREEYAWQTDGQPATVEARALLDAVSRLAAAALLARYWPAHGSRQDAALALAGGLLRADWPVEEAERFILSIAEAAGDEEAGKRAAVVRHTAETINEGDEATGWPRLAELIPEAVVKAVCKWLGITGARRGKGGGHGPSQATLLVQAADGLHLFHAPGGDPEPYAVLEVAGHQETAPLRSRAFRQWLCQQFYQEHGSAPNAQALQDALGVLQARALFDGPECPVAVRIAPHEGSIYLDLADPDWRCVEITPSGWQVLPQAPIRFRRPRGMVALPEPIRGGSLGELRQFVNVAEEDDWRLLVAWLLMALRPEGPFPGAGPQRRARERQEHQRPPAARPGGPRHCAPALRAPGAARPDDRRPECPRDRL